MALSYPYLQPLRRASHTVLSAVASLIARIATWLCFVGITMWEDFLSPHQPSARVAQGSGISAGNANGPLSASTWFVTTSLVADPMSCLVIELFTDWLFKVPRHELPIPERPAYQRDPSNSKISFTSPSLSFDADDEDSMSSQHSMQSEPDIEGHKGTPRYSGEDTRLTSRKELSGWYSYGFAAEVFVVCG